MADPVIIPEIPEGWCLDQARLSTLVGFLNTNLDIIVNAFKEAFQISLDLPGVPPITLTTPGIHISGWDPIKGELTGHTGLQEGQAFTGNKFPFKLGGSAYAPFEFKGFPSFNVPGQSVTLSGVDPMRITMDLLRVNYQIILEAYRDRGIDIDIDWSSFFVGCADFTPNTVNDINGRILDPDNTPEDPIDGPPVTGSETPTFGPGSGGDFSCYSIDGPGESRDDDGDGIHEIHHDGGLGDEVTVTQDCLRSACAFVAEEDGSVRGGFSMFFETNPDLLGSGSSLPRIEGTLRIHDSDCNVISEDPIAGGSPILRCREGDTSSGCSQSEVISILAGQRATLEIRMRYLAGSNCTASFSAENPWITFGAGATTPASLC